MTECLILGYSCGTSKKDKPYYVVHMALSIDSRFGTGYSAQTFWVDEVIYKQAISHKPLEKVNCDVRFSNGAKFLVGIE